MFAGKKKNQRTGARWLLALAGLAVLLLLVAGPGYRLDLWDFRFGFQLMRWAVYLAAVAGLVSLLMLLIKQQRQRALGTLISTLLIATLVTYIPWSQLRVARSVPAIHDISTDLVNVPPYVDIAPLRADAINPLDHPGETVAQLQRQAYPDLVTFETPNDVQSVFDHSLEVVQQMGWTVVSTDVSEGRIEAFDTTFWFGFIDDVVIRIQDSEGTTQVDVRSKSRVGRSDVGKNAERIRAFFEHLEKRMAAQ